MPLSRFVLIAAQIALGDTVLALDVQSRIIGTDGTDDVVEDGAGQFVALLRHLGRPSEEGTRQDTVRQVFDGLTHVTARNWETPEDGEAALKASLLAVHKTLAATAASAAIGLEVSGVLLRGPHLVAFAAGAPGLAHCSPRENRWVFPRPRGRTHLGSRLPLGAARVSIATVAAVVGDRIGIVSSAVDRPPIRVMTDLVLGFSAAAAIDELLARHHQDPDPHHLQQAAVVLAALVDDGSPSSENEAEKGLGRSGRVC